MITSLKDQFYRALYWATGLIGLSLIPTFIVYLLEKDVNPQINNVQDIYWWWIVTISSVGFGDIRLVTDEARFFASLVIIISLFVFALTIVEISNLMKAYLERKNLGLAEFKKYKDHIVIINYSPILIYLIRKLREEFASDIKIILISNTIDYNPMPEELDFVRGDSLNPDFQDKISLWQANLVVFLASGNENFPETLSIFLAHEIELRKREIITMIELINSRYQQLVDSTDIDYHFTREELLNDLIIQNDQDQEKKFAQLLKRIKDDFDQSSS